jgi:hypothetical protein
VDTVKRLLISLPDEEKGLIVRAIRLVPGTKLSVWVRQVLVDQATLEIAQHNEVKK